MIMKKALFIISLRYPLINAINIKMHELQDKPADIILDDTRLLLHAETVKELSKKGAKVVILAHQSRPGKKDFTTLSQHADALSKILKIKPIESEEEKKIFKDYYRNILKDYKSRGVIPWFKS